MESLCHAQRAVLAAHNAVSVSSAGYVFLPQPCKVGVLNPRTVRCWFVLSVAGVRIFTTATVDCVMSALRGAQNLTRKDSISNAVSATQLSLIPKIMHRLHWWRHASSIGNSTLTSVDSLLVLICGRVHWHTCDVLSQTAETCCKNNHPYRMARRNIIANSWREHGAWSYIRKFHTTRRHRSRNVTSTWWNKGCGM